MEAEFIGRKIFYLSPEMNFIHLSVHNLNHVGLLRDWIDLLLLLRNLELDWEHMLQCARSLGVLRPLFWVFQELHKSWNFAAPPLAARELSAYTPRWMEDRVINHRLRYFWRLVSRIASLDGWGSRLRYLRLRLSASPGPGAVARQPTRRLTHLKEKLSLFAHFWRRG